MSQTLAIARRDFGSYFVTPTGYVVTALFLVLCGFFFAFGSLNQGATASMRPVFQFGVWLLLFVGPAITMRMVAEETRTGTIESLMTSPVDEWQIIFGKFIAAIGFLLVMLVPTFIYVIVLEFYGRPDYGEVFCGYLGVFIAGLAYMASGLFVSTLSSSQVVAFLVAFFFWLALTLGTMFLPPLVSGFWAEALLSLNPDVRLRDFAIGLIDSANIAFFLAFAAVFLIAAVKSLQSRRWR